MRGKVIIAAAAVVATSWAASATCGEHLVDAEAAQAAVERAAGERAADVTAIQGALSTPAAAGTAKSIGVSLDRVRAAVPTLTDAELHDLAARAAAIQCDPAAGVDPWVNEVLIVILIVGIVVLVLSAV
jgi:hypothetical protein